MIAKQLGIGCGCSMEDDDTTEEQAVEFDRRSREKVFGHNDPSSATRPTRAFDCNRDAMAGFAGAHG